MLAKSGRERVLLSLRYQKADTENLLMAKLGGVHRTHTRNLQ
jgi:hypothetical protein